MTPQRFSELLDAYFDERLSVAESEELGAELAAARAAREQFWERAAIHGLLPQALEMADFRGTVSHEAEHSKIRAPWLRGRVLVLAMCAAALALAAIRSWQTAGLAPVQVPPLAQASAPPNVSRSAAVLVGMVGVEWKNAADVRRLGALLGPGWLRFNSGMVELQFLNGARVILEGPAEFEIISEKEGRCHLGKLTCHVPLQARGFRIHAPGCRILDYGTDFAVRAPEKGEPEVHVLAGKVAVALDGDGGDGRELLANHAVRITPRGLDSVPVAPTDFVREAEFLARANADAEQSFARWKVASSEMARDPAALVYYTFENADRVAGILPNVSTATGSQSNATVIGCGWSCGRWPGKSAIEFRRPSDHLLLVAPGVFETLTYLMWVRLDSLPHHLNALIVTEAEQRWMRLGSRSNTVGGTEETRKVTGILDVHWQINRLGTLMFHFDPVGRGAGTPWNGNQSKPVVLPERLGQWVCLACVYDSSRHTITQYLDGEAVSEVFLPDARPLPLGHMEIGNWSVYPEEMNRDNTDPNRGLNGKIDEVAVLHRALTPGEVRRFYEIGRPVGMQ